MPTIRLVTEGDADQVRRIYAPFCEADSHVSFEVVPPSVEEMRRRIGKVLEGHPWLVAEDPGGILGYAYAGPHRERPAYAWSVDTTIYIGPGHRRSGLGRALYTSLFAALRLQGYVRAFAGITLPNPGSVGLHKAMGFEPVGIYRGVGYKAGSWRDVAWYGRTIGGNPPDPPAPPKTLVEARRLPNWGSAIEAGLPLLGLGESRPGE